jgi:hypothetical protein
LESHEINPGYEDWIKHDGKYLGDYVSGRAEEVFLVDALDKCRKRTGEIQISIPPCKVTVGITLRKSTIPQCRIISISLIARGLASCSTV